MQNDLSQGGTSACSNACHKGLAMGGMGAPIAARLRVCACKRVQARVTMDRALARAVMGAPNDPSVRQDGGKGGQPGPHDTEPGPQGQGWPSQG